MLYEFVYNMKNINNNIFDYLRFLSSNKSMLEHIYNPDTRIH
jgi:hypothetical protein